MTDFTADTIFALSSAPGRAGVSVFRVSGPNAPGALKTITQKVLPPERKASVRRIYSDGGVIDEPLVLWLPGPKSFTGEDCAELHVHGSPAVIEAVAAELLKLGLRQAYPGEFTRRAVENGKMDLTEAEGLADLIDAETEGQREQAIRQMSGGLREIYEGWRDTLLDAMAQIEGEIDFADEADVPDALSHAAYPHLKQVTDEMLSALSHVDSGRAVRNGIEVAIIGAPNAGKSTLINALAGRDVAITSPEAGTTRDIVEATLRIAGLPVTLLDTAGLRETENAIEAEGVRRARARSGAADIRLYVHRPSLGGDAACEMSLKSGDVIYVNNTIGYDQSKTTQYDLEPIYGNAVSDEGIDDVISRLDGIIRDKFSVRGEAGLTRQRHRDCVQRALTGGLSAIEQLSLAPELASENIRAGLSALEELAGRSDVEEVFDRIFSRFCIGK